MLFHYSILLHSSSLYNIYVYVYVDLHTNTHTYFFFLHEIAISSFSARLLSTPQTSKKKLKGHLSWNYPSQTAH